MFLAEACEYGRSFLELVPQHAALLDIEPDHFDCYATLDAAVAAYAEFASLLPADGPAVEVVVFVASSNGTAAR